jgi:DNA-binding SARP family transcriptional activator
MRCYVGCGESIVDFKILGSIEAVQDGEAVALGGPRQRALLGRLLLDANRVVAADRLVEDLWDDPPREAHAALQNQVSRLRKAIGDRVVTKAPGYLVRVEPGELDLDRFRELVAHSGATADLAERSRLLRKADSVFGGTPLADVEAPFAAAESVALDELRLAAVEARIDSDLERGRHAELVPELAALIARQPLRERLRAQYIVALYRNGRQAEALEAYRETKRILDEELGLEPSPALRELEGAILRQEPELGFRAEPAAVTAIADAPPRRRRRAAVALVAVALAAATAAAAVAVLHRDRTSPSSPASAPAAKQSPAAAAKPPHTAPRHRRAPTSKPRVTHAHASVTHAVVHRPTPVSHVTPPASKPAAQPKERPATTTTPVTTTTPRPAPTPSTRTIADAFDDNQLDGTIWYQIREGTGWSLAQTGGHLEYTFSPSAMPGGAYNSIGGHLGTRCKFPGDFDARVDFSLKEWPPGNGIMAILWAFFAPDNLGWQSWRWSSAQWGDAYGSFTGDSGSVPLDDSTGTLRLVRHNGVVTASFLHKGDWQELTSGRNSSAATIAVGAGQVNGDGRGFTGHEVIVDFDNFTVTGQSPDCPPGSQPSSP